MQHPRFSCRVGSGEDQSDMVIPIEYDEKRRNDLPLQLMERLKGVDSRYESVITVDYDYVAKTEDK